jgi:hypothetical protein
MLEKLSPSAWRLSNHLIGRPLTRVSSTAAFVAWFDSGKGPAVAKPVGIASTFLLQREGLLRKNGPKAASRIRTVGKTHYQHLSDIGAEVS